MFGNTENINDVEAVIPTEQEVTTLLFASSNKAESDLISDAFIADCETRFHNTEFGA